DARRPARPAIQNHQCGDSGLPVEGQSDPRGTKGARARCGRAAEHPFRREETRRCERREVITMKLTTAFQSIASAALLLAAASCASAAPPIPAMTGDVPLAKAPGKETAVFAGGCFWGVQSVFQRVKGVLQTTAGYAGGTAKTATYDQVTTETT